MERVKFNSELELHKYLVNLLGDYNPEIGENKFFLVKMNEGIYALEFFPKDTYFETVVTQLNWLDIKNDEELQDYIKDRYSPDSFDRIYNSDKLLLREKGLADIDGVVSCDFPSYPCEIIDVLSESQLVDWLSKKEDENLIVEKQLEELKKLCYEYPPDLERIDMVLDDVKDFRMFYYENLQFDYIMDNADFLGCFISEYFRTINADWFGKYMYNEETGKYDLFYKDDLAELKHETYATKIIELFLKHGYDLNYMGGLVGASCLNALIMSNFNDEMVNVAKLLIEYGADPLIGDEEGFDILDSIEDMYFLLHDMRGCLDDDYLDNEDAIDELYEICIKAAKAKQAAMKSNSEKWYIELLNASAIFDSNVKDCPRCGCKGNRICYIHNGSIKKLVCPECGFTVKNATCDKDVFEYCLSHWNSEDAIISR